MPATGEDDTEVVDHALGPPPDLRPVTGLQKRDPHPYGLARFSDSNSPPRMHAHGSTTGAGEGGGTVPAALSNRVPEVAVVVTTRNRAGQLAELLAGLRAQSVSRKRFEVVVVDDGSGDDTASVLGEELDRGELDLSVITRERSGGAALGREQGWRAARAAVIAFTDDDCLPEEDWLAQGLRACAENPGSVVQGITSPRPDQLDRLGPFSRTMDVQELSPHFPTTNIFYPRALLEAIGGFDTTTYRDAVGGEDTDLAWRAIEHGAEAVLAPEARVYHAVNDLGPMGKIRVAARQSAVFPFVRHPASRHGFVHGVFRKPAHYHLTLALIGLVLPRRLTAMRIGLMLPYLHVLYVRGRIEGGGLPMAPYFLVHDLVEVQSTVRGALRSGRLLI